MLPAGAALRISIEEKFGTLSYLFIYALLEWLVIVLLFFDGLLAFLCNEITQWFELKTPCLLCTRLDHLLVQRSSSFYYNESFCEAHKMNISALAYCHVHKRLSDIRSMCQGCLLSSEKESSCDRRRPLVVDEGNVQLRQLRKYEKEIVANERIGILRCSCCGDPIKLKSPLRYKACLSVAAPSSPRAAWFSGGNGDGGSVDAYTELKLIADSRSELHGDEYGKEGINNMFGDEPKTPHFSDRNRFFGVALSDGAAPATPRTPRTPRRIEFAMEPIKEGETEAELVARLKRQVTLDRRSMMALYMELDEERSASAVAANNAMAMITRLQEEKAAVQMEALQYKRMMEGQAEYDQEAMQRMKDMLIKREEEIKVMGYELEEQGERYSVVGAEGSGDLSEVHLDEDRQDIVNSCGKMSNDPRVVSLDEDHQDQDIVNSRGEGRDDAREVGHDEDHQDIVNSRDEGKDDAPEVGHGEDHQDDIVNSRAEGSDDARRDEDHQDDIVNSRDEGSDDARRDEDHHDDIVNSVSEDNDVQCDVPCKVDRVNSQVMSPRVEDERKIQDELAALNYEGEMCRILCQLAELEEKLYSADDAELDVLAREVRLVKGRLRAVEAESVLLKHVAMSVQKRGVLSEIAQHLRQLRQ